MTASRGRLGSWRLQDSAREVAWIAHDARQRLSRARVSVAFAAHPPRLARLNWDDPKLAVASDPPLRRTYRLLQSWYREHVLGADYGYTHGKTTRPVGSLLAPDAVASDRALNFFDDRSILDYVDHRVPEVQAASGTLEEHRLRHNMLSSMPMAFSFVAALRQAEDRARIVSQLFGVDCAEVIEVFAEWTPNRPSAEPPERSHCVRCNHPVPLIDRNDRAHWDRNEVHRAAVAAEVPQGSVRPGHQRLRLVPAKRRNGSGGQQDQSALAQRHARSGERTLDCR